MHIEPGIVDSARLVLGYATALSSFAVMVIRGIAECLRPRGGLTLMVRIAFTSVLAFGFFELLPQYPMGVSEVHFIFATSLFLLFGVTAAAFGLALGLLGQGLFFAPLDLPQYGMNVTTLVAPLLVMSVLAKRIIPARTAYKDIGYRQVLMLSACYQSGIVAWVSFWVLYQQGLNVTTLAALGVFGLSYVVVVMIEPLVDLGLLALAKKGFYGDAGLMQQRVFEPA